MKTIGRTEEGNAIVEMTSEEHYEFIRLEDVLSQKGYLDSPSRNLRGVEMSPVFKALNDLVTAKYSISILQGYINNLAAYFGKVQFPKKDVDA